MSSDAWGYDVPVAPYFALVDGPAVTSSAKARPPLGHLRQMIEQALADAGMASGRKGRRRRESPERRVDSDLLKAGVEPGDPALRPRRRLARSEAGSAGTDTLEITLAGLAVAVVARAALVLVALRRVDAGHINPLGERARNTRWVAGGLVPRGLDRGRTRHRRGRGRLGAALRAVTSPSSTVLGGLAVAVGAVGWPWTCTSAGSPRRPCTARSTRTGSPATAMGLRRRLRLQLGSRRHRRDHLDDLRRPASDCWRLADQRPRHRRRLRLVRALPILAVGHVEDPAQLRDMVGRVQGWSRAASLAVLVCLTLVVTSSALLLVF